MDFGFLFDPERRSSRSAIASPTARSIRSCYDLLASEARLASFVAIAKGDVPARHWFRLGRAVDAGRPRRGADLLVGIDVRIPDAVAGDARAVGSLLEQTNRLIVQRQIELRRRARRSLGHLGIRLQRARSGTHLPVFELRRAGPWAQAGLSDERRHRAYATALAAMVDPQRATRNFASLDGDRWARSVRLLRGARLHAAAVCPKGETCRRARLHGASSRHDDRRDRQRAPRRRDARPLSRGADDPGDRTAVAGAHAARRRGRPSARRRSPHGGARDDAQLCPTSRRLPSPHQPDAADPSALERPLCGDADRGRLGLQPLARSRRDALARGRHAATTGAAISSCATSTAAPCGRRGTSPAASSPTVTRSTFTEDRAEFIRRDGTITTTLEVRRLARGRRRGSPRIDHERRQPGARHRSHLLCRDRAGAAGRRHGAPGFLQAVRRDRVSWPRSARCWRRGAAGLPTSRRSGPPISRSSKASRWAAAIRNRPGAFSRPRPRCSHPIAIIDGRPLSNTVGAVLDPVFGCAAACACRRAPPCGRVLDQLIAASREGVLDLVDKHHDATPSSARHAGVDAGTGTAPPPRHRRGGGQPLPAAGGPRALRRPQRCGPSSDTIRRGSGATGGAVGARHFRRPADRAACASTMSRTSASSRSCCAPTNIGG